LLFCQKHASILNIGKGQYKNNKNKKGEEMELQVTLLTIIVIILSVVIIALLVSFIALLVKVRRIMDNVDTTMQNIAAASDWLAPAKLIGTIVNTLRK
jgi:heme/copper-type cytochrome/quinol oxidase subunit 2